MSVSEPTKRTWIALGLAEALFGVAYSACALLAFQLRLEEGRDALGVLELFVVLLIAGSYAVLFAVPLAVHTAGRLTARLTRDRSKMAAASAQLVVGLGLGAVAAYAISRESGVELPAAVLAFVAPAGIASLGTHLLVPLAVRHLWIRIASWLLAAVPVALAARFALSLVTGNS